MLEKLKQSNLQITDLMQFSLDVYMKNLKLILIVITAIYLPLSLLAGLLVYLAFNSIGTFNALTMSGFAPDLGALGLLSTLVGIVGNLAILVAYTALIRAFQDTLEGKVTELNDLIKFATAKLPAILITTILFVIFMIPLTLALVIPAIYFGVKWMYYQQTVILEDKQAMDALNASNKLVEGKWMDNFVPVLVVGIVLFIAGFVVNLIAGSITGSMLSFDVVGFNVVARASILYVPLNALFATVSALIGVYGAVFITVLYNHRKLAHSSGASTPVSAPVPSEPAVPVAA